MSDFDKSFLKDVAHRPWALPNRPWLMTQSWHDLLFAHWRVDVGEIRARVPASFELDLFEGAAWIGIVPFSMSNVAPRAIPALPWVSTFPELNVRTYVTVGDRPGVYFFSLDAARWLAVRAARALFNLPYEWARMSVRAVGGHIEYISHRHDDANITFEAAYHPTGPAHRPVRGTIEHFLTERYCLYHQTRHGTPYRLEIHHPPWPLQPAEATLTHNTMTAPLGLRMARAPALLHFAKRQDVVAWAPVELA